MTEAVRTTCPYCGVGCGVLARVGRAGEVHVSGDPAHPANRGALCSKGAALGETLGSEGRAIVPRLHGREVGWDEALGAAAAGLRRILAEHGPDSVALYASGQLLTEDYYVANKLMKGFIGSANIDTNSRLCMASAVAGHRRAFGEDAVPLCYEDLELADLIVLVGSNTAWCHPVLYQRIVQAKQQRAHMRIVVIDPRRTPTCDLADLHLPLRGGSDVALFNGLLAYLAQHGHTDEAFVTAHTHGAARALLTAENTAGDIGAAAALCGLDRAQLQRFYEWFGATERVVTVFSQGVNQSSAGTDKVNAIINAHLLTGRIGRPGMGPFSLTGQPNAMGGREAGGFANTLAAHLELENPAHRELLRQFWDAPRIATRPGLKAVDLFEAIHRGRVRAVWIMATNPIVSLPNADRARAALQRCELVLVSDCVDSTDTTRLAHVLLPAAAWGEKDGTVSNSERRISRQRAFLPLSGLARPDWWIICQVARRLGFERGFGFASPAEIFAEHAALSALENAPGRAAQRLFNLEGLTRLGTRGYEQLEPVQWPVYPPTSGASTAPDASIAANAKPVTDAAAAASAPPGTARLFADGHFAHADGRARLVATRPRAPKHSRDPEYPLLLNTGRIRDQWHTMTRTGRSGRLAMHLPEPFVDLHGADALAFGLRAGSLVRVATRWGRLVARLRTSGEIARGTLFVPIHWSDANASDARVGALVSPAVDPVSGQPEFKHTPARVEPFVVSWQGFALARTALRTAGTSWWAHARGSGFERYELAGRQVPARWSDWTRRLLGADAAADWIEYEDAAAGVYRAAYLVDARLEACVFISARADLPSRAWLSTLFDSPALTASERASVLSGRPRDPLADAGDTLCACFRVGRRAIETAVAQGCRDVSALGMRLKAGTGCGSCIPELRRLIAAHAFAA